MNIKSYKHGVACDIYIAGFVSSRHPCKSNFSLQTPMRVME